MSAWGCGFFDNDNAGDWAYRLESQGDLGFVEKTLDQVLRDPDPLPFWAEEEALAAAETVARLKGNWGRRDLGTSTIDAWVESTAATPHPVLVEKARAALDRVAGESSPLARIWQGSARFDDWLNDIADLRKRLG